MNQFLFVSFSENNGINSRAERKDKENIKRLTSEDVFLHLIYNLLKSVTIISNLLVFQAC